MILPPISIMEAVSDADVFGPWFRDRTSFATWFAFLKAIFGIGLDDSEREAFRRCTGRSAPNAGGHLESTLVVGRRGGKSLVLALIAAYLAAFHDWSPYLTGGERGHIIVVAADRKQALSIFRYLKEMLSVALLAELIERETASVLDLSNGITVEILTADFRTIRGRTIVAALCDELAFWQNAEGSANPDSEIVSAIRPAMATVPGAMLLKASSPYARRGELWEDHRRYFGRDDASVLVWKADTRTMNPSVSQAFIDGETARDPANAAAEYGAEFRSDIQSFIDRAAVEACVFRGRHELPPMFDTSVTYVAFVDPSGGSSDSMTLAVAHRENDVAVIDVLREVAPPFSPESVVAEFTKTLKAYRVTQVVGDRYAGLWPRERFQVHGITYEPAARPKSDLYRDLLPIINGGRIELLDHDKAVGQICSLERRVWRGGRDSIDHPPKGFDDIANVIAGAASLTISNEPVYESVTVPWGHWDLLNGAADPDAEENYRAAEAAAACGDLSKRDLAWFVAERERRQRKMEKQR